MVFERISKLDQGDLWNALAEGKVSLEDIEAYALAQAFRGHHGTASYHFERLASAYEKLKQPEKTTKLREYAKEQLVLDGRFWQAALIGLELGQIDFVRSLYPQIKEWDNGGNVHTGILERRINALLSGNPAFMSLM